MSDASVTDESGDDPDDGSDDDSGEELPPMPDGVDGEAIRRLPFALLITDAALPDDPIVFVNRAFLDQTGYRVDEVIGRNCRFLQGEHTDPESVRALREAIAEDREVTVDIVNYRAGGERFVNRLMVAPLYDGDGTVRHRLGIQHDESDAGRHAERAIELTERLREMQHRMRNHLSMLLALIRLEANRREAPEGKIDVLAARVEALGTLYDQISDPAGGDDDASVALGTYVRRVCGAMEMLSDRARIGVNVDVEPFETSVDRAARVGLFLCEVLTNALRHAYGDTERGEISVSLVHDGAAGATLTVADDGRGLGEALWPEDPGTLGGLIVRDLVRRLDASLHVESGPAGTTVRLALPELEDG